MVRSYEIKDVSLYREQVFMRFARLNVGDKSLDTFAKSIDKQIDLKILEMVNQQIGTLINELYLNLDLQKLRELDGDEEKQEKFIRENTRFLERGHINIMFIKLLIRDGDVLTDKDIEYLNDLLMWEMNSIYLVPILEFDGNLDKETRINMYNKFVENMLDMKSRSAPGNVQAGISIPSFYPRRKIDDLFLLYKKEAREPTFVCIDFANQRISDIRRIGVIPAVNRHYLDEGNERYFIYGLNVRPYKRGEDRPLAEDILLVECGFNSFGGVHAKKGVIRFIPARTDWGQFPKLFWKYDYLYHPPSDDAKRQEWLRWRREVYGEDVEDRFETASKGADIKIKKFNFLALNTELKELSDGVKSSDRDLIASKLSGKSIPESVGRGITEIIM